MKIQTISCDTGRVIDEWTWSKLLEICGGDEYMANDFVKLIKRKPENPNTGDILKVVE